MKITLRKSIEVSDWDAVVEKTYGKPYKFQQQDGCKDRGSFYFTVPYESNDADMNDAIPEVVNHSVRGVKFDVWKARDPKTHLTEDECRSEQWAIDLWWYRNFYPDFQTVANDLHAKGLLEAGEYTIEIDW